MKKFFLTENIESCTSWFVLQIVAYFKISLKIERKRTKNQFYYHILEQHFIFKTHPHS